MRRLLPLALAACAHPKPTPMTWPALDAQLLADAAATFNFRLGLPTPLAVTPDGAVLFRRTPPRSFASDLFELDSKTGHVRTIVTAAELLGAGTEQLSDAEKARRERARIATKGIVEVDVSADGETLMFALGERLHRIARRGGTREAIDPNGAVYDPHLAPAGDEIAFVRDGDLWLVDRERKVRALTQHPEGLEYGVADFAAMEELDRRRGFWWSPDGESILFQRSDNRPVDTIYVADARHPETAPVPFKYPRAGTANAIVDLGVVSRRGDAPVWLTWDHDTYPYLARVTWTAGNPITIVVLSREQTDLAVIAFDTPSSPPRTLLTEHDDAWVGLTRPEGFAYQASAPLWLPDHSGFLWTSDRSGETTIERHGRDGGIHSISSLTLPQGRGMHALVGLDGDDVIVEAATNPTQLDVYGPRGRLSNGDGWSTATVDHGVVIITTLLHGGGRRVTANGHELPSVAEQPRLEPTTVIETVELGGRTHYAAITRPRAFDPHVRYPVLLKVYAGPHVQTVLDARDTYVMDQWYADAGFIVIRTDGRGTPHRGRDWDRAILKDLITVPLDDQIGALQALGARHRELDLDRVGVFGWSFGGYVSTMAVLLRPDIFKCAIAGAPVTDWQLYDTAYTERYMRLPEHNPAGYTATSALTHAAKLSRPLLLIHGITDDNVHFAHTLALIEALYVAGKRAEVITLSATHMVPDPKLNLAREQVQIDFFRQHLR